MAVSVARVILIPESNPGAASKALLPVEYPRLPVLVLFFFRLIYIASCSGPLVLLILEVHAGKRGAVCDPVRYRVQ